MTRPMCSIRFGMRPLRLMSGGRRGNLGDHKGPSGQRSIDADDQMLPRTREAVSGGTRAGLHCLGTEARFVPCDRLCDSPVDTISSCSDGGVSQPTLRKVAGILVRERPVPWGIRIDRDIDDEGNVGSNACAYGCPELGWFFDADPVTTERTRPSDVIWVCVVADPTVVSER